LGRVSEHEWVPPQVLGWQQPTMCSKDTLAKTCQQELFLRAKLDWTTQRVFFIGRGRGV